MKLTRRGENCLAVLFMIVLLLVAGFLGGLELGTFDR